MYIQLLSRLIPISQSSNLNLFLIYFIRIRAHARAAWSSIWIIRFLKREVGSLLTIFAMLSIRMISTNAIYAYVTRSELPLRYSVGRIYRKYGISTHIYLVLSRKKCQFINSPRLRGQQEVKSLDQSDFSWYMQDVKATKEKDAIIDF